MNTELLEALDILEKEKNISKDVMLEAIENSLLSACKNHFGTSDNIKIVMDRNTCDYSVYAEREVVEEVFDPAIEISLEACHILFFPYRPRHHTEKRKDSLSGKFKRIRTERNTRQLDNDKFEVKTL